MLLTDDGNYSSISRGSNVEPDTAEEESVTKVLEYGIRTALEDGLLSRESAKILQRTCKCLPSSLDFTQNRLHSCTNNVFVGHVL